MSEKNNKKNQTAAPVDGAAVIAAPNVEAVVEPVVATDAVIPTAEVEINKTEEVPLVEPTAIVPNLVFEQTAPVANGEIDAPVVDVSKKSGQRVRVICDGKLGLKLLQRGDITDDEQYVALLKTERGRSLVEEVR